MYFYIMITASKANTDCFVAKRLSQSCKTFVFDLANSNRKEVGADGCRNERKE